MTEPLINPSPTPDGVDSTPVVVPDDLSGLTEGLGRAWRRRPAEIVDVPEARRWFYEGRHPTWVLEEYERRHNMEISHRFWESWIIDMGLVRRNVRNEALIPWRVLERHRWDEPIQMLRLEAWRRAGLEMDEVHLAQNDAWRDRLLREDVVVEYRPELARDAFGYVARRPGIDIGLVRVPDTTDGAPGVR